MIALGLLLAASQPLPTPAWLAGVWAPITDESIEDVRACEAADSRYYGRDGTFERDDIGGDWRLAGNRLTELAGEDGAISSRIVRLSPNRMRVVDADGEQLVFTRCR